MNKILAVISREYITRVKTKGYIIGTILFPLIITFIFGGIFLFARFFAPSTKTYAVVDQTGIIFEDFNSSMNDTLKNGDPKFIFNLVNSDDRTLDEITKQLQDEVVSKQIDGYLVIPEDILESRIVKYSGKNVSDFEELDDLRRSLSRITANIRLANKGYPAKEIREEMSKGWITLVSHQVTEKGEVEKHGTSSFLLTYLLSYMLMIFIFSYGQTVTSSVIEEKSQRITETIISSIKPTELMLGKLFGICFLGMTQLIVIGGFIYALSIYGAPLMEGSGMQLPELINIIRNIQFTPVMFLFFVLFFFMGYFFYATIFAAIGAMVNTTEEGQQFLFPIIIINLIGFFIMFSVAKNPDTASAMWASLIPFFTPIVMFARIAVSDPILPSGAIISIITMSISIVLIVKLVSKIYRVGILMYGKKPSIKETWKWLKYK